MFQSECYINSDNSIIIEFDGIISTDLTRYILGIKQQIESADIDGFIEAVPAYNSLLVIFQAESFAPEQHKQQIEQLIGEAEPLSENQASEHTIPVCYDKSLAPDLDYVADHCGITTDELIGLHSSASYPVFMLGFLPGFLYLGELNPKLHCPRREDPRAKIEAGSVAIGGAQTGIYPVNSPGGWHIIGKTPMTMFDVNTSPPAIATPLDRISFKPITLEEFEHYGD